MDKVFSRSRYIIDQLESSIPELAVLPYDISGSESVRVPDWETFTAAVQTQITLKMAQIGLAPEPE